MLRPFEPAPRDHAADAYMGEIPLDVISDPLFLAWGLALAAGLWQLRRRPAPAEQAVAAARRG